MWGLCAQAAALKQKAAEATRNAREATARQIKHEETAAAFAKEATRLEEEVARHHSALLHLQRAARTADAAVEEGAKHAAALAAQSDTSAKAQMLDAQLPALRDALAAALEMQQQAEAGGMHSLVALETDERDGIRGGGGRRGNEVRNRELEGKKVEDEILTSASPCKMGNEILTIASPCKISGGNVWARHS